MTFDVFWSSRAEQELAGVWLDAADRNRISSAALEIERRLLVSPAAEGESRPHGRRILFAPPLAAVFLVDQTAREVWGLHVWRFRTT